MISLSIYNGHTKFPKNHLARDTINNEIRKGGYFVILQEYGDTKSSIWEKEDLLCMGKFPKSVLSSREEISCVCKVLVPLVVELIEHSFPLLH